MMQDSNISAAHYNRGVVAYLHEPLPCRYCRVPTKLIWRGWIGGQKRYVVACSEICVGEPVATPLIPRKADAPLPAIEMTLADLMG